MQFDLFERVDARCLTVFLKTVRCCLEEGDETQRITGLGILARFACISSQALELLFQEDGQRGPISAALLALLRSTSRPDLIAAVLKTVAAVSAVTYEMIDECFIH